LLLVLLLQDLVGNTRANLQLIFNKLVDDQHLPDVATDATKVSRLYYHHYFRADYAAPAVNVHAGKQHQRQRRQWLQQQQ
jgi:hypothetical protein